MKDKLEKLKNNKFIIDYKIIANDILISYSLKSCKYTERLIHIKNNNLKNSILESANELRRDILTSLTNENDYFGYDNKDDLFIKIKDDNTSDGVIYSESGTCYM